MADISRMTVVGAVPKAISLHQLSFHRNDAGWHCAVILDIWVERGAQRSAADLVRDWFRQPCRAG